ncbi:TnsA endonuclease N-terminal domain-containing protein [Pseudomonas helleri]|uniref:Heteromeric transposase endonuclease subunit TnsA n=2 Tax=Pseudomonas TaxID=286 RepID=A0A6G1W0D5_9PSED|nr:MULTISPECIES: TnsA endonuclease N-terminal domain-containing protein [Pseudomonas]MBJ2256919.1 TnsA endonuclease N-terminal domain-containing protein [Pseudomonas psychrophila]MEC4170156.1 TnsA endonuclease N-terminal domain-containing protein [Pseudomonas sp. MS-1(2024)]MQT24495.1 heteromeric transposase endonuclease subunit TnsA [Pseudomonas helleri]MQU15477.1 heteromeric transposase endonuclease subunit TnsA [Pseudomonas helleri]
MKREVKNQPVRKIGVKHRSVRGTVPKMGQYESTLERDLMELIRFNPTVRSFLAQPLTIEYRTADGGKRKFTPDGLIHFNEGEPQQPSVLYEVKFRSDFREQWKILMPKFRAAKAYCALRGWRFQVFTEREIRTPYLTNTKFLWSFLDRTPSPSAADRLISALAERGEATPESILIYLSQSTASRIELIPVLWHLIAVGKIGCDLEKPLCMASKIWKLED